ncbi:MAG: hypothetical protein KDK36_09105, partial [Leptospiraceae bacterium]|nr:hypothetical protein [Leptospiraceae bacterium]
EILSKEIDIYFNNVLLKGVNYNNYVFRTDENSLNRINNAIQENFLYDELTPYWISEYRIDTNLNKIPDSENSFYPIDSIQTLKFLAKTLKDHWKQCFFKRRKLLDNIIKLSKDELLNFNIAIEWDKV